MPELRRTLTEQEADALSIEAPVWDAYDKTAPSEPASIPQPSVQSAVEAGSPSAVREHEIALTERWAHLKEEYPKALQAENDAVNYRRAIAKEMGEIKRLLAAHKRLREPIRRKPK